MMKKKRRFNGAVFVWWGCEVLLQNRHAVWRQHLYTFLFLEDVFGAALQVGTSRTSLRVIKDVDGGGIPPPPGSP